MNKTQTRLVPILVLALLLISLFSRQDASAQATFNWTSGSGTDTNWSTIANWDNGSLTPGSPDTAIFGATATVGNAATINNVVDASTAVTTLRFTNSTSGTWHVTQIPTGVTLTTTTARVGFSSAVNGLTTHAAMTGGGALVVNGDLVVGNNNASGSVNNTGTILDLSGLNTFVQNAPNNSLQISAGTTFTGSSSSRSSADFNFAAASNNVTAGTVNLDGGGFSTTGNAGFGTVNLGSGTNIFNVGLTGFRVGCDGNGCLLQFPSSTGGLRIRGISGADSERVSQFEVGRMPSNAGSSTSMNTTSTAALFGHPVDIKATNTVVGRNSSSASAGLHSSTGTLSFDNGTVDTLTIEIGRATAASANWSWASGTVNVGTNGTLVVGSTFTLANATATTAPSGVLGATGTLNVTNGTVITSSTIVKGGTGASRATNAITMVRSSMILSNNSTIGQPAFPIDTFTIGDSKLTFGIPLNSTNVNVLALNNTSTTNNTINILSFPTVLNYPTTYRIIKYNSGTVGTFILGSLPPTYLGYLSNNVANKSVDFILTNGPAPTVKSIVWNGNVSGNWDTTTANWTNSAVYNQNDYVTFNDTATGTTTVNLTTSLTPGTGAGLTVSNNTKSYVFSGAGNIAGPTSLTKSGTNTLVIANSANNSFSGGVNINAGSVQLTNLDNLLPTNGTVSLANTAGASLDLNNYNQTIGALTGGGTAGGNVTLGNSGTNALTLGNGGNYSGVISGNGAVLKTTTGTETFYGANTYTGGTLILGSTLAIANTNGSATGIGPVTIGPGGTLQISDNVIIGRVAAAVITNGGTLTFNEPVNATFTNNIVGSGVISQNAIGNTTLPTDNTGFTGTVSINGGTLLLANNNAIGTPASSVIALNDSACLALSNNITVATGSPIQMFCKAATATAVPSILNVSGTNTLTPSVFDMSAGGANWKISSAAGLLIIPANFNNFSSGRNFWLTGAGDGELNGNLGNDCTFLKDGAGTWKLTGTMVYSGITTVSNGILLVTGDIVSSSVRVRGGTLGGTGNFYQPVTVNSGGILAPGVNGIGTLNVASDLTLNGTCNMQLDGTSVTGDQVTVSGNLDEGGTLNVTLAGTVVAGNTFTLFTAGTFTGHFSATNLPALSGGLAWETSNLGGGILAVVASGPPTLNFTQTGNVLGFSWTGSYKLQSQTNALSAGLNTNWFDYPGGGSSPVNVTINPAAPSVFFRLVTP